MLLLQIVVSLVLLHKLLVLLALPAQPILQVFFLLKTQFVLMVFSPQLLMLIIQKLHGLVVHLRGRCHVVAQSRQGVRPPNYSYQLR